MSLARQPLAVLATALAVTACGDGSRVAITADVATDAQTATDAATDATATDVATTEDVAATDATPTDATPTDATPTDADATASCGDGVRQKGELCDGPALGGATCETLGFDAGGELACNATCDGYVLDECLPTCGDGSLGAGELCDGATFTQDADCAALGYDGGTLACVRTCLSIDPSGCTTTEACGNGSIGGPESCDGDDLGVDGNGDPVTCATFGFEGDGTLACAADCMTWDLSGCGDNRPGWTCPPAYYGDGECDCGCGLIDPDCGSPATLLDCIYCNNPGSCAKTLGCGDISPANVGVCDGTVVDCGDGTAGPGEACDGDDARGATCESLGFLGGTLGCAADCQAIDTSTCEAPTLPDAWTCPASYFGDGGCDCGCGGKDIDCDSTSDVSECEYCLDCPGSGDCVDLVVATDTTQCLSAVPEGWTCSASWYLDGGCDCGCGVQDGDCDGTTDPAECAYCGDCAGSTGADCADVLDPADTTQCIQTTCGDGLAQGLEACDLGDLRDTACTDIGVFDGGDLACASDCTFDTSACTGGPPSGWSCDETWFGDGTCDCGCGGQDKDCLSTTDTSECAYCDSCGSNDQCDRVVVPTDTTQCIVSVCGDGHIEGIEDCEGADVGGATCVSLGYASGDLACDATSCTFDLSACVAPPVPDDWTCLPDYYHDGECDCGCGARDIDCATTDHISECAYCLDCGQDPTFDDCSTYVDPTDTTQCADGAGGAPEGWTCAPVWYGDGSCDCGCGVQDSDCASTSAIGECEYCLECGVEAGVTCTTSAVDGNDTTKCAGAPGCGDGALAHGEQCDGLELGTATCESLGYGAGTLGCTASCKFDTSTCGPIVIPGGWTCEASWFGDGFCDCGCGAVDHDCGNGTDVSLCQYCEACGASSGAACDAYVVATDTTKCLPTDCGNDKAEGREACDGSDLRGATCLSRGFAGGALACASDCQSFDESDCEAIVAPNDWTCNTAWYGDGTCDCGCGAKDFDCPSTTDAAACELCLACGASFGADCGPYVEANDTTTCLGP